MRSRKRGADPYDSIRTRIQPQLASPMSHLKSREPVAWQKYQRKKMKIKRRRRRVSAMVQLK